MLRKGMVGQFVGMILFFLILFYLTPGSAQEAYRVGCSMAITGPGAEIYGPLKDAIDIYFKEINVKGGVKGHPVKIIIEDDAAEPSKAATNAKKLVTQDKVHLLLNGSLSSTYAPMIQVAQQFKVPLMFAGGVCPPDVYPPKPDPYLFCSTAYGARYDSRFAISFIKGEAETPVRLALVGMNIPVSRGEIDFAEELSKTMGIEIVDKEITPPGTPDYTPFASKIKNAGANWAYAWAPWGSQVRPFEALRKLGWNGKYLAYAHTPSEDELKRLKDDGFYVFGTNAFFADRSDIHKKIKSASEKEKSIFPYTQLTEGWIAATVLEEVLKKTPWPPNPEKIRAAMSQVNLNPA